MAVASDDTPGKGTAADALGLPLVSCGRDWGTSQLRHSCRKSRGGNPNGSIHWIGCLSEETSAPHSRCPDHRGARNVRNGPVAKQKTEEGSLRKGNPMRRNSKVAIDFETLAAAGIAQPS